ncbi:Pycsar system effector family protein [Endozoicomonas atrinae]|uniref:Pycsar system effector family protein n=1 Tax=Endozoicomonas atrinae TaxID=1333660 RepID=UPI003B0027FF
MDSIAQRTEDRLWKTYSIVNEWIRYSDTKAYTLLAVQGVFIGLLYKAFDGSIDSSGLTKTLSITGLLLNVISVFFAFTCINPRLNVTGTQSPLYFGAIASFASADSYQSHFNNKFVTPESVEKELSRQIYINSKIADRKYKNVTYSMRSFVVSLAPWISFTLTLV